MGFFQNLISNFNKATARKTCRVMINAHNKFKEYYPNVSKRELYALTLSSRPTWKRASPSLYIFTNGSSIINIGEKDKFKDVIENVVINEIMPKDSNVLNKEVFIENFGFFQKIIETIEEEFEDFNE